METLSPADLQKDLVRVTLHPSKQLVLHVRVDNNKISEIELLKWLGRCW
jgi:hypothetical protein